MRRNNVLTVRLSQSVVLSAALSIFAEEGHPSVIKGSGKAKEGFSVCALLDRTVSTGGKKLLRSWCRQPSTDLELLHHRHDAGESSDCAYA